MTNRAGVVTELNRAAVLLTDWAEDRALGKTLASVLSLRQRVTGDAPADPALTAMADNEALAPVLDCQLQRRDGALLPLLYAARPVRGARGFVAGALVVFAWLTRNGVVFRQPGPAG